ncbi:MAG: fasciclin domain-containing protein [Acidobacteriaceae bacterium]|nr:fasciclin domain-containing protein [Acidobacteriaceae bacterium]
MKFKLAIAAGALAIMSTALIAQSSVPMVGGAPMYPSRNIVQNASSAQNLSTLVAAVKAAGLVDTLEEPGPFTVFAPTNSAFDKLPAGTLDMLLKSENQDKLKKVLTYHVVSGSVTWKKLVAMIKKDGGQTQIKTVEGGTITAMMDGENVVLKDEKGGTATVTQADVMQKNGVVHVIDAVLLPN